MNIQDALAIVNSGAHFSSRPLQDALWALKGMAMAKAALSGAPVRYLYSKTKPTTPPWQEHPDLVTLEGGPYHWDLIEVSLGGRAFHLPVPLAAQHGLLYAIKDLPISWGRRKSQHTGSTIRQMPPRRLLGEASRALIEWAAR